MDGAEILKWQQLIREVILADHVQDYIVRLTLATHPEGPYALPVTNQYLRWGSSPRGAQSLAISGQKHARCWKDDLTLALKMCVAFICQRCDIV